MNKTIIFSLAMLLIAVLISSYALSTGIVNDDLQVSRLRNYEVEEAGSREVIYNLNLENLVDADMDNLKVTLYIPELSIIKTSRRFDIDSEDEVTKNLLMELPEDIEPGDYIVRVTISNDEIRRVKHRVLEVR